MQSKNGQMNSAYDFKANPSTDINFITNSLKTMDFKPSNGKSPYYLIECKSILSGGINLSKSQFPISEILTTPFIEEDTLNPTHSPTDKNLMKMHGTLKTPLTHPLAEHVVQMVVQSV